MKGTIEMAKEAGFPFNKYGLLQGDDSGEIDADKMFAAFEALVRADEREACVKECEDDAFVEQWKGLAEAVKRIRSRGQK
jgi:hypothetical protein